MVMASGKTDNEKVSGKKTCMYINIYTHLYIYIIY